MTSPATCTEIHHSVSNKDSASDAVLGKSLNTRALSAAATLPPSSSLVKSVTEHSPAPGDDQATTTGTFPDTVRTSDAQRRTNAAWLRTQVERLSCWMAGSPHRWPVGRVVAAQGAILAGDERWTEVEVER